MSSSSSPSTLPSSVRTALELDSRHQLEVSRTVPVATASRPPRETEASLRRTVQAPSEPRLALGTNPPTSGLDAHLIAIGTPTPGAVPAPTATPKAPPAPEPTTLFLGARAFVPPSAPVTNAPRASLAITLLLGLLALAIAPLAPIAWMHAAEQLDLVARGMRRPTGKRLLHAVQGIGIAMTMLAVAATAFGLTVVIARFVR